MSGVYCLLLPATGLWENRVHALWLLLFFLAEGLLAVWYLWTFFVHSFKRLQRVRAPCAFVSTRWLSDSSISIVPSALFLAACCFSCCATNRL